MDARATIRDNGKREHGGEFTCVGKSAIKQAPFLCNNMHLITYLANYDRHGLDLQAFYFETT